MTDELACFLNISGFNFGNFEEMPRGAKTQKQFKLFCALHELQFCEKPDEVYVSPDRDKYIAHFPTYDIWTGYFTFKGFPIVVNIEGEDGDRYLHIPDLGAF